MLHLPRVKEIIEYQIDQLIVINAQISVFNPHFSYLHNITQNIKNSNNNINW